MDGDDFHLCQSIGLLTYNCNALMTNIETVLSLPGDIISIQETRLSPSQLGFAVNRAKAAGLALYANSAGLSTKASLVDKKRPGTGILVRDSLVSASFDTPSTL